MKLPLSGSAFSSYMPCLLDKTGQDKAREFAGQKVKVTGRVSGKNIRVTSIEPAA